MEKDWLLRERYGGRLTAAARRDLERLAAGEHVSYLIGWAPFLGWRIDLSARPLIPRPETEHWTEAAIEAIGKSEVATPKILDLFCGSGCIGIAALKHLPKACVDFADIEKNYFPGIRKSLRLNRIAARRGRIIRSDVFGNIGKKKYDFILANPPYVPTVGRRIAKSVLAREPHRALFAGKDGLSYIRRLLKNAKGHLNPGGEIVIEFDPPQKRAIAAYAKEHGWRAEFSRDQYGRWRYVRVCQTEATKKPS